MGNFYSDELERGIMLLYFQPDASKYPEGVELIKKSGGKGGAGRFLFPGAVLCVGRRRREGQRCKGKEVLQTGN